MRALVCTEGGFARQRVAGPDGTIAPYVDLREVNAPRPGKSWSWSRWRR